MGYTGGTLADPTYHSLGDHTEAFQVDFDPSRISYRALVDLFWNSHRSQRPAYSRQYRAVLFYDGVEQQAQAEASRTAVAAQQSAPVLTSLEPLHRFYRAEDYHQKYLLRRDAELMAAFAGYDTNAFTDSTVAARLNGFASGDGTRERLDAEGARYGLPARTLARLQAHVAAQRRHDGR